MEKRIEDFLKDNPDIRCCTCIASHYSHDTAWTCSVHNRLTFANAMCTEFVLADSRLANETSN